MNVSISASPELLALRAADELIHNLGSSPNPLLCPASGDTPAALYRELTDRVTNGSLGLASWWFVGLDEWGGMNGKDEGSCRWHLDRQFFQPAKIGPERIQFFDGRAEDLEKECTDAEKFIRERGGIDLAVIGLGLNGHIAMNEPGVSADSRSHIAAIHPETQRVGQKYFRSIREPSGGVPGGLGHDLSSGESNDLPRDLSRGITVGIGTLLEAKHLFLLVTGAHKAAIVKKVLEEPPTNEIPGTLLRDHPGLHVFLDSAAAQLLTDPTYRP